MSPGRFQERKSELATAVSRLLEAAGMPEDGVVRDAVIQRFEFTFELAWKTLKIYLDHQGLAVSSPRLAIKKAFEIGLITEAAEGDLWLAMLEDRNQTVHTYDEETAKRIYKKIVTDYAPLLKTLSARLSAAAW
jgi:nucleotidyltransferase substrate binding protein (TIGR01987 family)